MLLGPTREKPAFRARRVQRVRRWCRSDVRGWMKAGLRAQWRWLPPLTLTLTELRLRAGPRSALEITAHADCWAEPGLRDADWFEADPFVEPLRGPGGHLERFGTLI